MRLTAITYMILHIITQTISEKNKMASIKDTLKEKLESIEIHELYDEDYFNLKNLKLEFLELLHNLGIPEDRIVITELNDFSSGALGEYVRSSSDHQQHRFKIDIFGHFNLAKKSGEYNENKVKELLNHTMLHCYGQMMFHYFTSSLFTNLYSKQPYMVNQNERIIRLSFPSPNILGTSFANLGLKRNCLANIKKELMEILIDQYCSIHFSDEALAMTKLTREEKILRQDVEELCANLIVPVTTKSAVDKNDEIALQVGKFFARKEYPTRLIKALGYKGDLEEFPPEHKENGLSAFLFVHKAVLVNNTTIVDFSALAYNNEHAILVGPKHTWKKNWETIQKTEEIPDKNFNDNELMDINLLEFH